MGKEKRTPYERPPLSKAVLIDEGEPIPTTILGEDQLAQLGIEFITVATGASPRRLHIDSSDTSELLYLRTYEEALLLRSRLKSERRVAVIGAGFIGLEVAASARKNGCSVTVIEVGHRILMRGVPEAITDIVEARHRAAGVVFKLGIGIERILRNQEKYTIELADALFSLIGGLPN